MKTIKEIANEYAETWYSRTGPQAKSDAYSGARNGFIAGVNFATRWISINDEKPEKNTMILVKKINGTIVLAFFDLISFYKEKENITSSVSSWRYIEFDTTWY
jgi:hypothetical protein